MPRHAHVLQRGLVQKLERDQHWEKKRESSLMEWLEGWIEDMF
jgi:hypothetical protein